MRLQAFAEYESKGLSHLAIERLSTFGDLLLNAESNVTAMKDPDTVERLHFLDSLVLLDLPDVRNAGRLVDVGSGGGLPAVVLAIAQPGTVVVAVESIGRKCAFIEGAAAALDLDNLTVVCGRAEEYGHSEARESFDVATIRAVGSLQLDAEFALPLIGVGGLFVAMKGALSDEERIRGQKALDILGAEALEARRVHPFPGADNRWLYLARKSLPTSAAYPRRVGIPAKRPLGERR